MTVVDRSAVQRHDRGQRSACSPSLPTPSHRPWEAVFNDPEDVTRVRTAVGPHFGGTLYWIPGVVLACSQDASEVTAKLNELSAALGEDGLSTGILLLFHPGPVRRFTRQELAAGRIRVQSAEEALLDLQRRIPKHIAQSGGPVEKIACETLEKLGRESEAWLKARERRRART